MSSKASIDNAINLCKILNIALCGDYFPALTGGQLYKDGERKDIDIVIYRHRQNADSFEMTDIVKLLGNAGLTDIKCFGFVTKAKWNDFDVDLFNPESSISTSDFYSQNDSFDAKLEVSMLCAASQDRNGGNE